LTATAQGLAGAAVARWAGWPEAARAQAAQRGAREIGKGVHVLTLGATNVLAVEGPGGLALVDGAPTGGAGTLADMLAALPQGGKVHTLFNTHWHPEQTGSNESLAKAGVAIVAQENTKNWLTTDVTWPWNHETVQPLPAAARPTKTFYDKLELDVGGTKVRCGHLRDCPHTDGDQYVFFPDHDVLAVGDAVYGTGAGWPAVDWWTGGWIGGLVGGLEMLLTVASAGTRIVPARGAVLSTADLKKQLEMYSVIWERLLKTLYGGGGPKEALASAPTRSSMPRWALRTRSWSALSKASGLTSLPTHDGTHAATTRLYRHGTHHAQNLESVRRGGVARRLRQIRRPVAGRGGQGAVADDQSVLHGLSQRGRARGRHRFREDGPG
jgi:glyoxylase-like metal-dependent hydrolase (beta-lactamase superfamily II)